MVGGALPLAPPIGVLLPLPRVTQLESVWGGVLVEGLSGGGGEATSLEPETESEGESWPGRQTNIC